MKNFHIAFFVVAMLATASTNVFSQANDWILPPSTRMSFSGFSPTITTLSGSSAIAGCGAGSAYLFQQYAGAATDYNGNGMVFVNNCGVYNTAGTNIFSGTPNNYQHVFSIPAQCKKFYAIAWEDVWGPPHGNKLTLRTLDASNATAITETGSTDLVNDGYMHSGVSVVVAALSTDMSRKVYYTDGTSLKRFTVFPNGTLSSVSTVTTMANQVDPRTNMELSPDGKYLITVSLGGTVDLYDLTATTVSATSLGSLSGGLVFSGIEYVPFYGGDRVYISYHSYTNAGTVSGTLGYVDIVNDPTTFISIFDAANASPATTLPGTTSQFSFGFTEIELGKDGGLYFANNPNSGANPYGYFTVTSGGALYRLDPTTGSLALVQTTSGGTQAYANNYDQTQGYFIQQQIDGENYNKYNFNFTTPTFLVGGVEQENGAYPGTILLCNNNSINTLPMTTHIDGYHSGYTVQVLQGTTTGGGGSTLVFNPYSTQPSVTTATFTNSLLDHPIDLVTYFPWLTSYTGKLQITVTVSGCTISTYNYYSQIFDLTGTATSALNFLMKGPGNQPDQAKHPSTTFITFTQPVSSAPNKFGWLGASSVGVTGYSVTVPTGLANTYHIVVDEVSPTAVSNIVDYTDIGGLNNSITYGFNYLAGQTDMLGHSGAGYGWFQNNYTSIRNNAVFKATVTVNTQACGDVTDYSYFKIVNGGAGGAYYRLLSSAELATELSVYPMPTKEAVTFKWGNSEGTEGSTELVILDLLGHIVKTYSGVEMTGNNMVTIDLSNVPSGMYYYKLTTQGGTKTGNVSKN